MYMFEIVHKSECYIVLCLESQRLPHIALADMLTLGSLNVAELDARTGGMLTLEALLSLNWMLV